MMGVCIFVYIGKIQHTFHGFFPDPLLLIMLYSRIRYFILSYVFFYFKMHIISIFYQFLPILTNFDLILGRPWWFFQFLSINNNSSFLFYSRLPSFYNFLCIILCQNAYNTNFLSNFLKFSHFLTTLT